MARHICKSQKASPTLAGRGRRDEGALMIKEKGAERGETRRLSNIPALLEGSRVPNGGLQSGVQTADALPSPPPQSIEAIEVGGSQVSIVPGVSF